jgi:hypothetical protein
MNPCRLAVSFTLYVDAWERAEYRNLFLVDDVLRTKTEEFGHLCLVLSLLEDMPIYLSIGGLIAITGFAVDATLHKARTIWTIKNQS